MKINSLFNEPQEVNIRSYLEICGIKDIDSYLSGQVVEPYSNYDNIEECASEIIRFIKKEGDANVN